MSSGRPLDIPRPGGALPLRVRATALDQASGVRRPIMNPQVGVEETRLDERADDEFWRPVPIARNRDVKRIEAREVAVLGVVHGPPPQEVQMPARGHARDA